MGKSKAVTVLALNTVAFTVCFAVWMLNGVLVTFLVEHQVFNWTQTESGWLIGIPVLSGAVFRLPVGILTDKYGGRIVYASVMVLAALPLFFLGSVNSFWPFFFLSLGFGLAGTSFAVGIAYTSVWFEKRHQGTALGIFGAGNAGAALTSIGAPKLLNYLTAGGTEIDGWRTMPTIFGVGLITMAVIFYLLAHEKKAKNSHITSLAQRLRPLKELRVWRFGLYYFLVFGGFVALAQWLIPYYVNAYAMSVATAGLMAAIFSFPSGVIRALGGYMSDRMGARRVMYLVLGSIVLCCAMLIVPRMDIEMPGKGVMAVRGGTVTAMTRYEIEVDGKPYALETVSRERASLKEQQDSSQVLPASQSWQEPVVEVGEAVVKKQLLARGVTHIYFPANVWLFTGLVFVVGIMMGIGKAAVYKLIPDYFPDEVGVVGGVVGVVGGLGGFVCPIIFGYLLESTGIWTTCWIFFSMLSLGCLWWLHSVIQRLQREAAPHLKDDVDEVTMSMVARVPPGGW